MNNASSFCEGKNTKRERDDLHWRSVCWREWTGVRGAGGGEGCAAAVREQEAGRWKPVRAEPGGQRRLLLPGRLSLGRVRQKGSRGAGGGRHRRLFQRHHQASAHHSNRRRWVEWGGFLISE